MTKSPYSNLNASAFWRKSVAQKPSFLLDPVIATSFEITATKKVATAGSCFAQHISRFLAANGLNYLVTEQATVDVVKTPEVQRNFGVFSARFGNIYTTRQLLQLLDRAYGHFKPIVPGWNLDNGRIVDPFRPNVEPGGFTDEQEMIADREKHLAAVRRMFESLDVFVFTLGLTEGWIYSKDGAALPLAPGVSGGEWTPSDYEFHNFTVREVTADLEEFIRKLRIVNPASDILLTVSPVPLIATYSGQHVLSATVYSKSVLRVAAEEASRAARRVDYFPSYEIITTAVNADRYFEDDLRSVSQRGIDHVVRIFSQHYIKKSVERDFIRSDLRRAENAAISKLICDEEAINSMRIEGPLQ
jgi:hypothetical protein